MVHVLFAALGAAAVGGGLKSLADAKPAESAPAIAPPAVTPPAMHDAIEAEAGAIEGSVLEVLNVPNYTYLRVGAQGSEGTWTAVPTTSLKVGDHARVVGAAKMPGFTSTTLKRTFDVIYFGNLQGAGAPHDEAAGAAPDVDPHQGASARSEVEVKKVDRAAGPNGKTIAEVIGQRAALVGKTVRVHATVVKVTPRVLGRTYLHVRDGSGDSATATHDLVVTTESTPAVGDVVTIEGVVVLDRDVGAGYTFPTLIEDAKIL